METVDQKLEDSTHSLPTSPLQSRGGENKPGFFATCNDHKQRSVFFQRTADINDPLFLSGNKENLHDDHNSMSLTCGFGSSMDQPHALDEPLSTPSPICSLSKSSPSSSSCHTSMEQFPEDQLKPPSTSTGLQVAESHVSETAHFSENKESSSLPSTGHEKDIVNYQTSSYSPTESSCSSSSEGGLISLLANKLFAHKENGSSSSRHSREITGSIDEHQAVEDTSNKPLVEGTTSLNFPGQDPEVDGSIRDVSLCRTTSEAVSELSLGSAKDRTFSMEFDAMLVAAVVTGIRKASFEQQREPSQLPGIHKYSSAAAGTELVRQATPSEEQLQPSQLPGIQEESSAAVSTGIGRATDSEEQRQLSLLPGIQEDSSNEFSNTEPDEQHDVNAHSSARVGDEQQTSGDRDDYGSTTVLTPTVQGHNGEANDCSSNLSEALTASMWSLDPHGTESSEIHEYNDLQRVPVTDSQTDPENEASGLVEAHQRASSVESRFFSQNGNNKVPMVLGTKFSEVAAATVSSPRSSPTIKKKNSSSPLPIPSNKLLDQIRRDKMLAQATAYQDAKNAKCDNRYVTILSDFRHSRFTTTSTVECELNLRSPGSEVLGEAA
ncbi:hypothetical protein KP509_38G067300 [Ceratopteris richardii]|uniref:Uncharacterized protein n=1 Tax=Ceratopteris richardii TaxID=49495 RepID=A0A8T2Q4X9_CERRI|nr:hypothetical protein KP509_38G067300 [Ceratopteris richardii]